MNNNFITINFFSIEKQDFTIPIFKKICNENETKKDFLFPVKVFSLPSNTSPKEVLKYFITFDMQEHFSKDNISSLDNRYITLWYLSHLIKQRCDFLNFSCKIGNDFLNIIDFLLNKSDLGQESICILPSYQNKKYGIILDYHFFKNKEIPYSIEMQKKSLSLDQEGRSNKNYYSDKYDKINIFIKKYFDNIFRPLDENNNIMFSNKMENIEYQKLKTKNYVFANDKISNSQFNGIMKNGPYSNIEGNYLFGFVYRESEKYLSHELYYALKGERFPTFKGLEKMLGVKIDKGNVFGEGITEYNEKEIERVISNILHRAKGCKVLPIILVPWNKDTADKDNSRIYYYMKYRFLQNNIPCQFVYIEKIKKDYVFKWIVSSIALQIFTKLGGSPWCLVPSTNKCLIIGIGQAHRKNENNIIERYYCYSIQNDSTGLFKDIKILSDDTDRDKYLNGLANKLKNIISTQINDFNSFVVHTSFRLRKDEMNAINETIKKLAIDEKEKYFAVMRFNDDHHYMGYDLNNNSLIPYESSLVKISSKDYLIWFEGLQYGNNSIKEKIGPPIQVIFDFPKNFYYNDIQSYIQDAINLSGANWRGFNAKTMPVSMLYSNLLSKFIAAFHEHGFKDINIENITPWFI